MVESQRKLRVRVYKSWKKLKRKVAVTIASTAPEIRNFQQQQITICSNANLSTNIYPNQRTVHDSPSPPHSSSNQSCFMFMLPLAQKKERFEWRKDKQYSNKHVRFNDVLHLIEQSVHGT